MEMIEQVRQWLAHPGNLPWLVLAVWVVLAQALSLWWLGRARRASLERLEARLQQQAEAGHDAVVDMLHQALERHGDRFMMHSHHGQERLTDGLAQLERALLGRMAAQREDFSTRLTELAAAIHHNGSLLRGEIIEQVLSRLAEHARADRELLSRGLEAGSAQLSASMETLSRSVDERLNAISGRVDERLDEGFRKTNETFASVMARLATIDEAQKKIDGLTTNVVSLQELLGDKRARGAFGEVQLEALVRNMLPADSFEFQKPLSNGTRVDCLLTLPAPTGLVAVDAKFPLENYHRMLDPALGETDRRLATNAFRADVRRHIDAIADKYIIDGETSDGAVMFVPAEAVFAEIHAYHPEVVAHAQRKRVWVVSPTTLMAVLNTARAVLKDVETRKQIHVIRDALGKLAKDFGRFDARMEALARHIAQASRDVQEVQVSSRKISAHFHRIESAQLDEPERLDGDDLSTLPQPDHPPI